MIAPRSETIHHVRDAAFDKFVSELRYTHDQASVSATIRKAFCAGWKAREAVMHASVLEAPH